MRTKDVLTAFIVVVAIIAGILVLKNRSKVSPKIPPTATPSIQQLIENKFNGLVIPKGESIELKDVSGGSGMGIATRTEIIADLPALSGGQFYQGWLEENGKSVLLGRLSQAKGGWILDYNSSRYPGYNKVVVTLGTTHILEGSF